MRRLSVAAAAATVAFLVLVAAAWACTPQPRSFAAQPDLAGAGGTTEVVGTGVPPMAPIEIRWDDLEGTVIGTATADVNGQFKAPVTVPHAVPGMHAVVFLAVSADSSPSMVGRLPFVVSTADGRRPATVTPGHLWDAGSRASGGSASGRVGMIMLAGGVAMLSIGSLVAVTGRRRARVSADL